ncbi:hypothetical protein QNM99_27895 [Pseudomonas sp. PCH446]
MTTPTRSASTQLALKLQLADLTQMLGLLQEVAWQPLSAQARLFLQPESLFGLYQLLCHVLPTRRMRPQGAAPMAFALQTLRRALLHEPDPRRRVELAHDCVDALLLRSRGGGSASASPSCMVWRPWISRPRVYRADPGLCGDSP